MKINKIIIIIILILSLSLLCSCDKNEEIEDSDQCELIIYERAEVLTYGTFNISKDFGIDNIELLFISNNYNCNFYVEDEDHDTVEIIKANGTNTNLLDIKFNYADSVDQYKDYTLNSIFVSVNTNSDTNEYVKVDSFDAKVNDIAFKINVDLVFNIIPDAEFIQATEGTLLLKPYYVEQFEGGIRNSLGFYKTANLPIKFDWSYYFNKTSNYLFNDIDYFVINKIKMDGRDYSNITDKKFVVDIEGSTQYKEYDFTDDVIGLKANKKEFYHWLFSLDISALINFDKPSIYYISLSLEYYFSYDESIRTICLGSFVYNDRSEVLQNIYG